MFDKVPGGSEENNILLKKVQTGEAAQEPFKNKMARQILSNNRGSYRMHNYQQSIKSEEDLRRQKITEVPNRKQNLNEQILKLQGEMRDAAEGLNVIESRCNVIDGRKPIKPQAASFNHIASYSDSRGPDMAATSSTEGGVPSEVQYGFNRYHSTTPMIPKSPVSITSKGTRKELKGCQ